MRCPLPGCPCLSNRRQGWPTFDVLSDDLDVDSVLSRTGEPGAGRGLYWHDKFRVFLALEEQKYSASRIALTLGCTPRTVVRWRSRRREMAQ